MPGIKELKTRIKSIGSTRKITKAMQMVSAAKMRRAQQAALNSRSYSDLAWELIRNLTGTSGGVIPTDETISSAVKLSRSRGIPSTSEKQNLRDSSSAALLGMTDNKLLQTFPKATKTGIIIISTNTGLVGSFNSNLMAELRKMEVHPSTRPPSADSLGVTKSSGADDNLIAELFVMGRKAKDYALRLNKNLKADFQKFDTWVSIESIYPLARMVADLYKSGEYRSISIIYNKFISTLSQKPTVKQLLPFVSADHTTPRPPAGPLLSKEGKLRGHTGDAAERLPLAEGESPTKSGEGIGADYLFEPDPAMVLNSLLPRIIESQIYQAVLESDAGEHSARMVTMKNATEAAGDLISDLTLTYNQLRQNKITTELAEITAGKIALE